MEERGEKREAEAVFQAIDHKRAKTRLTVNGRDGNHDATCMLVLISPDTARERLSFRRIVLFTSTLAAASASRICNRAQMAHGKGDARG